MVSIDSNDWGVSHFTKVACILTGPASAAYDKSHLTMLQMKLHMLQTEQRSLKTLFLHTICMVKKPSLPPSLSWSGKTHLVVNYEMDRSTHSVVGDIGHGEGFRHHSLKVTTMLALALLSRVNNVCSLI